jgi:hypothetical protein
MTKKQLIAKAKLRIRKTSNDMLDEDVGQLVEVALTDLLPCSLPCGGLIKALCIFFHGPTALSVNGLWVMCIATP